MTAKQYLSQAYRLNERINSDLSELDRLRDLATSLSGVNYDGVRVSKTRSTEAVANRIFEQQIYRCLPQMDTIDRIIIRCMVLHERDVTERQLAALISKATGQKYSHQAVHKRIPAAAKRLADLLNYAY